MGLIFLRNKIASGGGGYTPTDSDAAAYITAVETADGQSLEDGVREAIDDFVIGCKADGIWTAIKASCILAGARTLAGALTPLVGPTPTNLNFVSGDYDRELGLQGGSYVDGKYIDSNYADDSVAQNNLHYSVYLSAAASVEATLIGTEYNASGYSEIKDTTTGSNITTNRTTTSPNLGASGGFKTGLHATSRDNSADFDYIIGPASGTFAATSNAPTVTDFNVFRRNAQTNRFSNARIQFYSIGEALTLSDLETRISTLMTDLGNAIP